MQNQIDISLDKTSPIICKTCGSQTFTEASLLRKASKLVTGTAQDAIIPIPIFMCTKCNTPLEETLPVALKNLKENNV